MKNLFFLLLAPTILLAQGSSMGSSYLKLPTNSRTAALGESLIADSGSVSSSFLNPANLATVENAEILVTHTEWIQDVQTEFLAATTPFAYGNIGFAINNTNVKGIEVRDLPGPALSTFTARFVAIQLLYAAKISNEIFVGSNIKYFYEKIFVDEASGYGLDFGLLSNIEGVWCGASVANLGSVNAFRSSSSNLPSQLRIGASHPFAEGEFDFLGSAAFVHDLKEANNGIYVGGEVYYDKSIAIRLGYQTGIESRSISGGVGFKHLFMKLDYAFVPFSFGLGTAHMLSISFSL